MDLGLNEIQTMLQNLAREFMVSEMPTSRVLEIDESPSGFAVEVWAVRAAPSPTLEWSTK